MVFFDYLKVASLNKLHNVLKYKPYIFLFLFIIIYDGDGRGATGNYDS